MELHRFFRYAIEKMCKEKKSLNHFSKKVRRYNKTEPKRIYKRTQKKLRQLTEFYQKAEAGGFEPPVRLPVRQFSKLLVSATHPNFQ